MKPFVVEPCASDEEDAMAMETIVETDLRRYGQFIAGVRETARATIERIDPATGEPTSVFAAGDRNDVERAIRAARRGFDQGDWPRATAAERGDAVNRWAELVERDQERLARIEMHEVGKPLREARADISATVALIRQAAAAAYTVAGTAMRNVENDELGVSVQEPIGVVGAIIAWNYPAVLFASKVPFALAAGCTTVVKPASLTAGSAMELAYLAVEAGIPGDAINVVSGSGSVVGAALAASLDVDSISFTGSTEVGARLAATSRAHPQKRTFELGGKGATIVFSDADLDAAAAATVRGFTQNAGQTCTAGTRLLVESSIAERFLARVATLSRDIRIGRPEEDSTEMGPLVSDSQYTSVRRYVDEAIAGGAVDLAAREAAVAAPWFAPAVLDGLAPGSAAVEEEIFGPVLVVQRFDSECDAIEIANDTPFGLSNGVWTNDITRAMRVMRRLRSGTVWINTVLSSSPALPFGGVKASGFGREKGLTGVNEYLTHKSVYVGALTAR